VLTNKQTPLKKSTLLRDATPVGNKHHSNALTIRSPVVIKGRMRLATGWGSRLCVSFSALKLVGWQEGYLAHKSLCHLSQKVLFCNKWRKKTDRNQLTQVHWESGCYNRGSLISPSPCTTPAVPVPIYQVSILQPLVSNTHWLPS